MVNQFSKMFLKAYGKYVTRDDQNNDQLLERIIRRTVKIQSDFVFKLAEQFRNGRNERDLEEDMNRK